MSVRALPLLGAVLLLAACAAEPPFLQTDATAHRHGVVRVCYTSGETPPEQVTAVAEAACARFGRTARLDGYMPAQCAWTAPDLALFHCEDRPRDDQPGAHRERPTPPLFPER